MKISTTTTTMKISTTITTTTTKGEDKKDNKEIDPHSTHQESNTTCSLTTSMS